LSSTIAAAAKPIAHAASVTPAPVTATGAPATCQPPDQEHHV
jgi:hypothetical protein